MRTMNHENIVKLYEVFESSQSIYLVMDFLEGGTLYDKTNVKYKFHIEETRKIIRGLIKGLAHMHKRSINLFYYNLDIMHRDLKPENIIFR